MKVNELFESQQLNELKLPSKLKRWAYGTWYEQQPEDVIKRQRTMSDQEVSALWAWHQEDLANPKYKAPERGTPRDIQIRALEKEVKRRRLELPKIDPKMLEQKLVEGYESKVLAALKAGGVTDCYFEKGTLVCCCDEDKMKAKEILKKEYPTISQRPPIVVRP